MITVRYRPNLRPQFWHDSYGIFAADDDGEPHFNPSLLGPVALLSVLLNGAPTVLLSDDGGNWGTLIPLSWSRVALARIAIDFGALEALILQPIAQPRAKWRELENTLL